MNPRRGFNRLFVVLTFVWALYCLLVYPIQREHQVDKVFKGEFQNCLDERTGQEFRDCIKNAELKASTGMEMWSLEAYYAREAWFLGLIVSGKGDASCRWVVPGASRGFCVLLRPTFIVAA